MTADGPDMKMEEYKQALRGTWGKYVKTRYKIFSAMAKTPPPWAIIDDQLKKELVKAFHDPRDKKKKTGLKYVVAASYFFKATGGTPKTKEERAILYKLMKPLLLADGEHISEYLPGLMEASQKANLTEAYRGGKIAPELVTILNDSYELTAELYQQHNLPERTFLLPYLLEEKKLDFTPFKGPDDTGDEWYFNYRMSYSPLPIGGEYTPVTLQQVADTAQTDYFTEIANLQQAARNFLEGLKPTEKWLRECLKLEGEALEKAKNDYFIQPGSPEVLLKYAEAAEWQYQQRQEENTPRDIVAPFDSPREAGFYINPVTCKIYDLRPYWEELHGLFSVKNWEYLKDFANAIREVVKEFTEGKQLKENFLQATSKRAEKVPYPIDKVNRKMWQYIEYDGQGQLAFAVEKMGSGKEISIMIGVEFGKLEGIKITDKLTPFDKRVYIAVSALFNAGNNVITLTQVHYAMGNTKRPNKGQLERINESITKMRTANFYIDNIQETDSKYKYPKVHYDGALLPMERVTATAKGRLSEAAIHIFREPPLMTFARERKQITTFEAKLLQSPISKTDATLAIEDYLLERIAMAKAAAGKKKVVINDILFETMFAETGIKNRLQKARAKEKTKTFLDYYVECGYIKKYTLEQDRITFFF